MLGRIDEAEALTLEALNLRRAILGGEHPAVAQSLNGLAQIYLARGGPDQLSAAERLFREALKISRAVHGEETPGSGDVPRKLGWGLGPAE